MTRASASRLKRRLAIKSTSRAPVGTRPLFRYFDDPAYADALARGEVWITTLEVCRNTENAARADAGEATMLYKTGTITGTDTDPSVQLVAQRMRWSIGGSRVNIINCQSRETLVDAYVLCTTERGPDNRLEKMGAYCVRIDNAQKFFELTTVAMRAQREVTAEFMDYITYRERSYQGTETSPGHIGFIKPRDKYAEEREIRLLWEVRWELPLPPARLEPFLLQCPEVASLCTRID